MKILVTGLCSLHWGRLEYGNIGNYYIVEPVFQELRRVFPQAEIRSTFQMTEEFNRRFLVNGLPLEYYYAWNGNDLSQAILEYGAAECYAKTKTLPWETGFLRTAQDSDLIISLPGEMWGDYAEPVGKNRLWVEALKMRSAQLLGKKTVLMAAAPGPFTDEKVRPFALETLKHFSQVQNREAAAADILREQGLQSDNVATYACPSFLFEKDAGIKIDDILAAERLVRNREKALVGLTFGGFNMPLAPYDRWPREDWEYEKFAEAAEHVLNELNAQLLVFSHTNGFDQPPNFRLKPGRDHQLITRLQEIMDKRGLVKNPGDLLPINNPLLPSAMKAMLGQLDMLISGRLHAAVGAISQNVPVVYIPYTAEYKQNTKFKGFAELAGLTDFVPKTETSDELIALVTRAWQGRDMIRAHLETRVPKIKKTARSAFDDLRSL